MAIVDFLSPSHFSYSVIIITIWTLIIFPIMISSDQNPDTIALLQLKQSLTNIDALNSWQPGTEPCGFQGPQWAGLVCADDGGVTGLRIGAMGLSGKIDIDALMQMRNLRTLSITDNSFSGPIPEFNRLTSLKGVFLSSNQFSGEIPPDFFKGMASLKKLWLSNNNLTGDIPLSLAKLRNLIELHLDNNQFSGNIPEFKQKNLKSIDLSNNNLKGEIPPTLAKFNASSFDGNAGLCGKQLGKPCNENGVPPLSSLPSPSPSISLSPAPLPAESRTKINAIAYGVMALSVVILGLMAMGIIYLKRKQERMGSIGEEDAADVSMESVGWEVSGPIKKEINMPPSSARKSTSSSSSSKRSRSGKGSTGDLVVVNNKFGVLGMADLMKAAAEVLGNGSVGSSYKATMSNGFVVVVKRVKEMSKVGKDGFDAEISRMSELRHPNILTPLAYHYRKEEKLLIHEYIPNGSLLYVLHGDHGPKYPELNWPTRLKIIKGIARGLDYLSTEYASSDLPHGNLKSSNVLIASNHEPLLTDYRLSSLITDSQLTQLFAYKSPEVSQGVQVSPKCDVYCLGIVILEVMTRKYPRQYVNQRDGGADVVEWVKYAVLEGREAELLDPEIATTKNSLGEMRRLLQIGVACAENSPAQRLDIREATRRIEEIQVEGSQESSRTFNMVPPSVRDEIC